MIYGPMFGKSGSHYMVVGPAGFLENTDEGMNFRLAAASLPPGFTVNRVGANYAWDAKANIIYASTMTKTTFQYQR